MIVYIILEPPGKGLPRAAVPKLQLLGQSQELFLGNIGNRFNL
jgi:hypothetical protein